MNHDAIHCLDYKKGKCPATCHMAKLTEELRNIAYWGPVSWSNLRGTIYCPKRDAMKG